ncbi:DinB family protein [Fodinicola acaciae]|uniref:DinB family protein n=1 Tax=Fodinicola acaciae TaxID=2681555 RepID=UPI001C9E5D64|nr:DinB family protein [Fodinicola acaciae]
MPDNTPTRSFGWWDMWTSPEKDPRERGDIHNDERSVLVRYLRDRRLTFEMKCDGLDAEQLARRSVEPSNLSLLGLLRHLADVERFWFRIFLAGEDVSRRYRGDDAPNGEFDGAVADPAVVAEAWQSWRAEIAFAEKFVDDTDLGFLGKDGKTALREVVVHMIEEYARHNGHADFLRERIDGRVGQ